MKNIIESLKMIICINVICRQNIEQAQAKRRREVQFYKLENHTLFRAKKWCPTLLLCSIKLI